MNNSGGTAYRGGANTLLAAEVALRASLLIVNLPTVVVNSQIVSGGCGRCKQADLALGIAGLSLTRSFGVAEPLFPTLTLTPASTFECTRAHCVGTRHSAVSTLTVLVPCFQSHAATTR